MPRRSDRPRNRGWWSDRHPGWLDCLPLHGSFVACFADFCRAQHGALDFSRAPHGAHDSTPTSRSITSFSGCAGAIDTASTSAVAASEGRSDGTSAQPPSDDHAGEVGLRSIGRQTHVVSHLITATLSDAHLRPHRLCQLVLASCHGGRI
jgi:hypothetical protein